METRSGIHATRSPRVRSGLATRTGMRSSFTLAHFPGNDGVQTDVVDYDESPGTPANRASGYRLELGCHRLFFATDSGGNAFPS